MLVHLMTQNTQPMPKACAASHCTCERHRCWEQRVSSESNTDDDVVKAHAVLMSSLISRWCVFLRRKRFRLLLFHSASNFRPMRTCFFCPSKQLTSTNLEVKKFVAFQEGFERLFDIMDQEGMLESGSVIVKDCLDVCLNVLAGSSLTRVRMAR